MGLRLIGLCVLGAGLLACGDDFAPYNRLASLRVLAIRSEPVAPVSGETTTLTPLIYTPPDTGDVSYAWSWCPIAGSASQGGSCLIDEAQLAGLAQGASLSIPPYDLGTGPTATFTNSFPKEVLDQICAGGDKALRVLDCSQGFGIEIKLTVSAGDARVVATRRLRLLGQSDAPDDNPRIDGLRVVLVKDQPVDLVDELSDDTPTLPRQHDTPVEIGIPAGIAEPYRGLDDRKQLVDKTENLLFTWFVESGKTDSSRTNLVSGGDLDAALRDLWRPASVKDYPRDTARIIVVVRDDRDGVGWRSGIVRLGGGS